jgi:hypothetical protein
VVNKKYNILKKFLRKYLFIFFCLLTSVFCLLSSPASAYFDFNLNCRQAMLAILDLRFKDARLIIGDEKISNPDNGYVIYLEHYAESIELIITEDEKIYEKLINNYAARMKQMDLLDDGSPDNKWLQAEMLFQTGLAQIRFGTRISGVSKMLSSYKRIKENRQKYPGFWQNRKLAGTFDIILDFIPPFMRWATDIFGFKGDSGAGLAKLREYCEDAKSTPGLAEEGIIFTNLGYMLTWKDEEGYNFMAEQDKNLLDITLVKYLYANIAYYTNRNDLTLQLLNEIHPEKLQARFYHLDYIMGRAKLNHLEKNAGGYLERFLNDYSGLDYKKDVCNRLSYYWFIEGDTGKFEEYRAKVATIGQDMRERDREAIADSRTDLIPHTGLLKARLLCDGGYFSWADSILQSIDPDLLSQTAYELEYYYRKGRICQLTGKTDMAIAEFNKVYSLGRLLPYTFATRSALQLGNIYEAMNDYPLALQWYQNCLDTYSSSHTADGVEQMAEKGRDRMKEKF